MSEDGSILARKERHCSNCDHSRAAGKEGLNCCIDPPEPCQIGQAPPTIAGMPPKPIIIPILRPTFAWYCCSRWAARAVDHPDENYEVVPTHEGTEARQ
jgi:hypothetical protein